MNPKDFSPNFGVSIKNDLVRRTCVYCGKKINRDYVEVYLPKAPYHKGKMCFCCKCYDEFVEVNAIKLALLKSGEHGVCFL